MMRDYDYERNYSFENYSANWEALTTEGCYRKNTDHDYYEGSSEDDYD